MSGAFLAPIEVLASEQAQIIEQQEQILDELGRQHIIRGGEQLRAAHSPDHVDEADPDLQAAIALSLEMDESLSGERNPAISQAEEQRFIEESKLAEEEREAIALSLKEDEERSMMQAQQASLESRVNEESLRMAALGQKLKRRREKLNELHELFQQMILHEMDQGIRDELRSQHMLILMNHVLIPSEGDAFKEIGKLEKQFYDQVDNDSYRTIAEFEAAFKNFLTTRLNIHLSYVGDDPFLINLIKSDEELDATLIRQDLQHKIDEIQENELKEKERLAIEDSAKVNEELVTFSKLVKSSLGDYALQPRNITREGFLIYLASINIPADANRLIVDRIWEEWELEKVIRMSLDEYQDQRGDAVRLVPPAGFSVQPHRPNEDLTEEEKIRRARLARFGDNV